MSPYDRPSVLVGWSALIISSAIAAGCVGDQHVDSVQTGYRGAAMEQNYQRGPLMERYRLAKSTMPAPIPPAEDGPPGPLPWQNVRVLNDISVTEFLRTMTAMATWVGGNAGNCGFCHNVNEPWSDTMPNGQPLYRKQVARRMLQMVRQINGSHAGHVKNTGVTCYTCHLGKAQPNGLWYFDDPNDFLRLYLDRDGVRVVSNQVAPSKALNRSSVKQTEMTYAMMISISRSLGVNCTYCHNTRQFASWQEAPPARVTALRGEVMVRQLNTEYLSPLAPIFPKIRLGAMGDAPKLQCVTCHNGNYKPLFGAAMAKDYPAMWGRAEWNGAKTTQFIATPVIALGVTPSPSIARTAGSR